MSPHLRTIEELSSDDDAMSVPPAGFTPCRFLCIFYKKTLGRLSFERYLRCPQDERLGVSLFADGKQIVSMTITGMSACQRGLLLAGFHYINPSETKDGLPKKRKSFCLSRKDETGDVLKTRLRIVHTTPDVATLVVQTTEDMSGVPARSHNLAGFSYVHNGHCQLHERGIG